MSYQGIVQTGHSLHCLGIRPLFPPNVFSQDSLKGGGGELRPQEQNQPPALVDSLADGLSLILAQIRVVDHDNLSRVQVLDKGDLRDEIEGLFDAFRMKVIVGAEVADGETIGRSSQRATRRQAKKEK